MVDVSRLPPGALGYVPTPALVAPIEHTLPRPACLAHGGHAGARPAIWFRCRPGAARDDAIWHGAAGAGSMNGWEGWR
ncbi:MAG: hypothetical protein JXR75_11565 [Rhodobacteraceae bacterium]|nr:hypothetical protein [Paracoccaceae bacterium]